MMVIILDGTLASIVTGLVLGVALGAVFVFYIGHAQSKKVREEDNNG